MTIEEMRAAKAQAEAAIHRAVQQFMSDTGLRVQDVRIGFVDAWTLNANDPNRHVSGVTLEVRL